MTNWTTTLALVTGLLCAVSAAAAFYCSRMATKIRSLSLLQSEIMEIDDCVHKLIVVIRRMEGRQTALMGKHRLSGSSDSEPQSDALELMDKAALRRYFGLVPGKPAKHAHGNNPS